MFRIAALFLVMAVTAAVLGLVVEGSAPIAMILFFLFVILSLIYVVLGLARHDARRSV